MNEGFKDLIHAIGVLTEMTRLFYKELIKVGFTQQEALYLAAEVMKYQIKPNNNNQEEK
jgi:hypothetical protein